MMITIQTKIDAPKDKVWEYYTQPDHITKWNFASPDWCCPSAENDLKEGSTFNWRMEACDGSTGFDFRGTYDKIEERKIIEYTMDDGRKVQIKFDGTTNITLKFDSEKQNSDEMQRQGWQAILDNFKKYVESH